MELLVVAAVAFAGGVAVGIAAFLTARYGPAGTSWSFRGNGALAVYTVIPALLAGGWTAAILRRRRLQHWLVVSVGVGVVGLMAAVADALLLPLFGPRGDQAAGSFLLLALLAWTVAAPAGALWASHGRGPSARGAAGDAAAWLVGLIAGAIAMSVVVPPGS